MSGERSENQDSRKTKIIKAGVAAVGALGLVTAGCGPVEATETTMPESSPTPRTTETMESPPSYEVNVESITGEKIPLATSESLGMAPKVEVTSPTERMLSEEVLEKLASDNSPLLYRVVDSKHPLSEEYVNSEVVPGLVDLSELTTLNDNEQINKLAKEDLVSLIDDSKLAGVKIYIRSGYRSFWQQQHALDKLLGDTGKVTLPGQSQHQTGLAVDFSTPENRQAIGLYSGFEKTEAGRWLESNAWEYGFVQPYINGHDGVNPLAEPHHYLYVGKEIARIYHELKMLGNEDMDIFQVQEMISQVGAGF